MKKFDLQLLAAETGTVKKADVEPAISIDFTSRLATSISELQEILGIVDAEPVNAGTNIKIYKYTQVNTPTQVAEGETIPLTEIKRELAKTIEVDLKKYRKQTTAEAIQKSGRAIAVNGTDEKLLSGIRKSIKTDLYKILGEGTGTATGATLQAALAGAWGAIQKYYVAEDLDATPIFFVPSDDVAGYLASASVTTQEAFGMTYIENFLGLGTAIVSPSLPKGKVVATAKENLRCAYVSTSAGDVAQSFGLTSDETGLVGMTHQINADNATLNTLAFSGVTFYPEYLDGVIVATIVPGV